VLCHRRRGIVLDEPSVMVVRSSSHAKHVAPLLVGREARALIGRCPVGLATVRPLHDGVIVDLEAARAFIRALLSQMTGRSWRRIRPRAVALLRWSSSGRSGVGRRVGWFAVTGSWRVR